MAEISFNLKIFFKSDKMSVPQCSRFSTSSDSEIVHDCIVIYIDSTSNNPLIPFIIFYIF